MKKTIRYFSFVLVLIILLITIGKYNSIQSMDDLAYVVALGIDVGTNNRLKVTFQFTMPNASGDSTSGETAPTVLDSVECSSIDSGINLMNTYMSKELNLSHCKVLVFSEQLAQAGISKEIYSLVNKVQIRPDSNIIISKCDARLFIEDSKPILENLVAKYYEISPRSSEYTGYTSNVTIGEFFNSLTDTLSQPFGILRRC